MYDNNNQTLTQSGQSVHQNDRTDIQEKNNDIWVYDDDTVGDRSAMSMDTQNTEVDDDGDPIDTNY